MHQRNVAIELHDVDVSPFNIAHTFSNAADEGIMSQMKVAYSIEPEEPALCVLSMRATRFIIVVSRRNWVYVRAQLLKNKPDGSCLLNGADNFRAHFIFSFSFAH